MASPPVPRPGDPIAAGEAPPGEQARLEHLIAEVRRTRAPSEESLAVEDESRRDALRALGYVVEDDTREP